MIGTGFDSMTGRNRPRSPRRDGGGRDYYGRDSRDSRDMRGGGGGGGGGRVERDVRDVRDFKPRGRRPSRSRSRSRSRDRDRERRKRPRRPTLWDVPPNLASQAAALSNPAFAGLHPSRVSQLVAMNAMPTGDIAHGGRRGGGDDRRSE